MSTGLFADEEDGYNIDQPKMYNDGIGNGESAENIKETKYKLKVNAPANNAGAEPTTEPAPENGGDMGGLDDVLDDAPSDSANDKPFDDEPFDAGVEANEDTDPAKFIQQLAGKLGQSLRQFTDNQGQPDFDLEKFAVNSVLSATHTSEMDQSDQKDIINKVKGAGKDDGESNDGGEDLGGSDEPSMDEPSGEDSLDFGEEPVEEIKEELPLSGDDLPTDINSPEMSGMVTGCQEEQPPIDDEAVEKLKAIADLQESKKSGIFVDKTKLIEKLRLMENTEPAPVIEPKPLVKPEIKPAKPMRETERPFLPKRRDKVQPDPKGDANQLNERGSNSYDINGKEVDLSSLEIDGVERMDYPDFSDAYFTSGTYVDGTPISFEDLEEFEKDNPELLNRLIFDREMYL